MEELCEEVCEKLGLQSRTDKIAALKKLQVFCENPETTPEQALITFNECYLHVLKCYADRFESVRDQAATSVSAYISKLPPCDYHFINILTTLSGRMGKIETVEESEELRLIFIAQLLAILQTYERRGLASSLVDVYENVYTILVNGLRDEFPAVKEQTCECIITLSNSANTYAFRPWAERLTKPLYLLLNHKHSQVRIKGVRALTRIALHIDANNDTLGRLFMEVSPLLMDSMPLVRLEVGLMGTTLLLELRDRYSFFDKLTPLVLCCLKDDTPHVREHITPLWLQCGRLYYEENEKELNDKDIADQCIKNYPNGVKRPSIGCRALVQRSLRMVKVIAREMSDWKENVRLHSLKLLYVFVMHAEAAMTALFFEIYPDLARACQDTEKTIAAEAFKAADLMGRLLSYNDWFDHALEGLTKNSKKEGYVKCFYYMYRSTLENNFEHMFTISKMLTEPDFSQTFKPELQKYVIKLAKTLLEKWQIAKKEELTRNSNNDKEIQAEQLKADMEDKQTAEFLRNLYLSTMKIQALASETPSELQVELLQRSKGLIQKIAKYQGVDPTTRMHHLQLNRVLEDVQNLDTQLDGLAEPVCLLYGLINICKFQPGYLKQMQHKIVQVLKFCCDEAKVKIFTGVSMASLDWHATICEEVNLEESVKLLREFIQKVVEPHLPWRAGAEEETMRALAAATLCSLSQGAEEEMRQIMPSLLKHVTGLIEDRSAITRNYIIKTLKVLGPIKWEELKGIAWATLQRLDDPAVSTRELAASLLPKLQPLFGADDNRTETGERESYKQFVRKAMELLLLHLEGPDMRVKKAMEASILEFAVKNEQDFKKCFVSASYLSYNNANLMQLLERLPFEI